jgi:hypothetical protein
MATSIIFTQPTNNALGVVPSAGLVTFQCAVDSGGIFVTPAFSAVDETTVPETPATTQVTFTNGSVVIGTVAVTSGHRYRLVADLSLPFGTASMTIHFTVA